MSDKPWYKKWWIWGIVVVVMAMFGGAMEKKKPAEPAPAEQSGAPTATANNEATKAVPEVAPQKTQPVAQQTQPVPQKVVAPPKPLEWKPVVRVAARGKKQSDTFALRTAKQRLLYNLSGNENASMCWIYVIEEGKTLTGNGGVPAATVDKIGPGDTLMRRAPGNYYLEITAANCDCNVEIQELQ